MRVLHGGDSVSDAEHEAPQHADTEHDTPQHADNNIPSKDLIESTPAKTALPKQKGKALARDSKKAVLSKKVLPKSSTNKVLKQGKGRKNVGSQKTAGKAMKKGGKKK